MSRVLLWGVAMLAVASSIPSAAHAQDPLDRDSWNVATGDWGNDDNWVDDLGELSGTPLTDDDRWALVGMGVATVSGDHSTAGLTIGNGAMVQLASGGSLEVALPDFPNSVGQTLVDSRAVLQIDDGGSYKGLSANIPGTLNLSQGGSFELSDNLAMTGTFNFGVNASGNASVTVGGEATIGGTLVPEFDGVSPGFGQSLTFAQADSVVLASPTLVFPTLERGLEAQINVRGGNARIDVVNKPILQVDRATKNASIMNVIGGPIEITGYAVESALGLLDASSFDGFGGATWDRPNPQNTVLAEFSLDQTRSIAVNDSLDIGAVYNVGPTHPSNEDVAFFYFTPEGEILEGLVEYVGPANDLVLNVNPVSGEVTIQHLSPFVDPVEVTGYSVRSASGSLNPDAWTSLEDGGTSGWLEANPGESIISEINTFESTIFDNGTVVSLGNIFDLNGERDLVLEYTTADQFLTATVEYQSGTVVNPPMFLEADFDQNGTVEFSDFLILSGQFGNTVDPPGTPPDINGDGTVNFPDFLVLSSQFGQSSSAAAVPEPGSLSILLIGSLIMMTRRRHRKGGE